MKTVADNFESAYARQYAYDALNAKDAVSTGEEQSAAASTWSPLPAPFRTPLARALWVLYRGPFLRVGVLRFVNTAIQLLPAMLIQRLLRWEKVRSRVPIG